MWRNDENLTHILLKEKVYERGATPQEYDLLVEMKYKQSETYTVETSGDEKLRQALKNEKSYYLSFAFEYPEPVFERFFYQKVS